MGASIQVRGIKAVMRAFEMRDLEAWAIFQGKYLNFKGIGSMELEETLKMLEVHGSDAIYTLKVYDGIADVKDIKERTEADGSIGFKLGEENAFGGGSAYTRSLEDRLRKLEKEKEEDQEEDKTIGGRIGNALVGLLESPNELVQLIGAVRQMMQPQPQPVGAIGRVTTDFAPPVFTQPAPVPAAPVFTKEKKVDMPRISDEQKIERLSAAIDALEKNDPDILQHLEKLALIAAENPQLFKMMLLNLDQYPH